jgi:asparagine synthase (glutamine-hydrolysing)
MCGIAAVALRRGRDGVDVAAALGRMAASVAHRGPDDEGILVSPDRRAGLASRRLAIRDLSPAGHMPMAAEGGLVSIAYNGEVYNADALRAELERGGHAFASHSDTEVVLRGYLAWGDAVVERLRGMFAFAVMDLRPSARRLFLARDRLGIKPLYWTVAGEAFVAGSELREMYASGLVSREVDPAGLVGFLLLGSVPNPLTIQAGVRALEPGHTLSVPLDDPAAVPPPRRYWSLPTDVRALAPGEDPAERVRELLADAVKVRLVSDVPIGAFLSGGLDSGAVVGLMRHVGAETIRTCSMVFEEGAYSEAPLARAAAKLAGAEHYERVVTAGDVRSEFDRLLEATDQPTVDGVNTYFVSQTARQAGLTVALSGLGGDELFGGYAHTFRGMPRMLSLVRAARAVPGGGALAAAALGLASSQRMRKAADALRRPASRASAYLACRGMFSPGEVRAMLRPGVWEAGEAGFDAVAHVAERAVHANGPAFNWVSRAELGTYTHHQLLRDTDAMSMAHSLEVRVPLLDHLLVEAVLRLPPEAKTAGEGPKPLLTRAVGDLLPPEVRDRRDKQGFTFPFAVWLKGALREHTRAALDARPDFSLLRRDAVERVWREFEAGRVHWSRVWALAVL